jgi:putative tryptophan/tyrosine transport system substrate-binding protein
MIAAFRKGLSEAGYVEGKNVRFDHAWANDQYDLLPTLASGLVERRVSHILAASTPSAIAAKSATTTIPIAFAIGGDPVRTGLVSSLNRPGGNLTGAAHINVDTAAKAPRAGARTGARQEVVRTSVESEQPVSLIN